MYVRDLTARRTVLSLNFDRSVVPSSAAKLYPVSALWGELGSSYLADRTSDDLGDEEPAGADRPGLDLLRRPAPWPGWARALGGAGWKQGYEWLTLVTLGVQLLSADIGCAS